MLTVPNIQTSPTFDGQSIDDSTDDQVRALADDLIGVISGCAVSQHTGSDMNVAVAAGVVQVAGVLTSVSAVASIAIAAAGASDRKDIVIYTPGVGVETSGSGTTNSTACKGALSGTAGWTRNSTGLPPVKPAVPTGSVLLAEVYVASTSTVIITGNILDKTLIVPIALSFTASATTTQAVLANTATVVTGLTTPTLQPGVYEIAATVNFLNGATLGDIDIWAQMVSGTATGLPANSGHSNASVRGSVMVTGSVTVTAAGALEILVQSTASMTFTIENTTPIAAKPNATSISVNAY